MRSSGRTDSDATWGVVIGESSACPRVQQKSSAHRSPRRGHPKRAATGRAGRRLLERAVEGGSGDRRKGGGGAYSGASRRRAVSKRASEGDW